MKQFLFAMVLICSVTCANAQQYYHLYGNDGQYLGNTSSNKYDQNSIHNPYGQYGNKYAPNSIHNPYGKYGSKSPTPIPTPTLRLNNNCCINNLPPAGF